MGSSQGQGVQLQKVVDSPEQRSSQAVFTINLVAVVAIGTAASGWLAYYTDIFPEVGGLLALGGVLSWLAFISKMLREDRQKALQGWVDEHILCSRLTLAVLALLALSGLALASFRGTVEVRSVQDPSDRTVTLTTDSVTSEPARLLPGGQYIVNTWTSPFKTAVAHVKVSGYPEIEVPVRPWHREVLYVKSSFLRPVILLRPSVSMYKMIANPENNRTLIIRIGDANPIIKTAYGGVPIWVGCDRDVQVPTEIVDRWRSEMSEQGVPSALIRWLHPEALAGGPSFLAENTMITVSVVNTDGTPLSQPQSLTITKGQPFPMEVEVR